MTRRQVSRVCPNCRAAISERARPGKLFTVMHEQVCLACGTRYSKPTPVELAIAAVVVSVPILLLAFGIAVGAAEALLDRMWLLLVVLAAAAGFSLTIAISALAEGLNAFFEVRTELAPQGFAVLPKEPEAAASKCPTNADASSAKENDVR